LKLLLDTHAALWVLANDSRLSRKASELIGDEGNLCYLSAASVWEVAIKHSVDKLDAPSTFPLRFHADMALRGVTSLPVYDVHAAAVASLPFHHRDPFDRLLVAQAKTENMSIVSKDKILGAYGVEVLW
jgi:PIN domain nuclease of toxin-antitoxin system